MKKKLSIWGVLLTLLLLVGCPTPNGGTGSGVEGSFDATTGEGTVKGVKFKMISIAEVTSGGIGDNTTSDNKRRPVKISAYMIGETEVTQELWKAVMGNNPSHFQGNDADKKVADGEEQAKRPVEMVNWYEAVAFCNKLTEKVNGNKDECVYYSNSVLTTVYESGEFVYMNMNKKGFRLPTETEWEWAAKGGSEYKWAGTNTEGALAKYAWYKANSDNKTHEVKKKKPNDYELYDMSGNVWEWNWDRYAEITSGDYLGKDYTGASSGSFRVYRGGSCNEESKFCTSSTRSSMPQNYRYKCVGFRLACRP